MKKRLNKKLLTALCLTGLALAAAVGGTLAIYTNQTYQRSVVRNRDNGVIRFSSDKLYRVERGQEAQRYYYPMGENQRDMTFQVCNFDQVKSTLIHKDTITYDISFTVRNGGSDTECQVFRGTEQILTLSTGQTDGKTYSLKGAQRAVDTYKIQLPDSDEGIEVEVTVTPKKPELTQNKILCAVLIPVPYGTVREFSVKSEFTDSRTELPPGSFAAYNLLVSATGKGRVRIQWNSERLDIDPYFLEAVGLTPSAGLNRIEFPMDSMGTTGSYLITFYQHGGGEWESWAALEKEVTVTAVTTQTNS